MFGSIWLWYVARKDTSGGGGGGGDDLAVIAVASIEDIGSGKIQEGLGMAEYMVRYKVCAGVSCRVVVLITDLITDDLWIRSLRTLVSIPSIPSFTHSRNLTRSPTHKSTRIQAIVFKPFKGEVLDAQVTTVNKVGFSLKDECSPCSHRKDGILCRGWTPYTLRLQPCIVFSLARI